MKRAILLSVFSVAIVFSMMAGDILTLKNGMRFEGKVKQIKEHSLVFKTDIGSFIIPSGDIEMVEFEKPSKRFMKRYNSMSPENCQAGKMDASLHHGKGGGHFVLGFLFGPFAMIGTALANPTPMKGKRTMAMSENSDLFDDPHYLKCYKRKAKGNLILWELGGWASWILLAIIIWGI
jgi:hypothetical protein